MSLMMICVISCNFPIAAAQQNNTSFLTYTNTELGFTIRYPWNWTVNASDTINGHKVTSFTSPDRVGVVFVQIENATRGEIAVYNLNDAAKTNTIRTHLTPSEDLIELDIIHYLIISRRSHSTIGDESLEFSCGYSPFSMIINCVNMTNLLPQHSLG